MAIVQNQVEIREGIDGENTVFQLPNEYIKDSVQVAVVTEATSASVPAQVDELGGTFFSLESAPGVGTFLRVTYNIETIVVTPSPAAPVLTQFEQKNVNQLLEIVQQQSQIIKAMDQALKERISRKEFDKWASAMEAKLVNLEHSIIGLQT